jgi:hypothetical protein
MRRQFEARDDKIVKEVKHVKRGRWTMESQAQLR